MSPDERAAYDRLVGVMGVVPEKWSVALLFGPPVPKGRPRFDPTRKKVYTPAKTEHAETALAWAFVKARAGLPPHRLPLYVDTVALVALFFVKDRQRRDVDNLLKLVMDAATKARMWKDDSQVIVQAAYLLLDHKNPRTVVALAPCVGTLTAAPLLTATGAL